MSRAVELQIHKILEMVSPDEKEKNLRLQRQSRTLIRALLHLRGAVNVEGTEKPNRISVIQGF